MLSGIDLSQWQTVEDYDELAQAVDFAMVRASFGDHLVDPKGWEHRTGLRSRGVPLGHYHYVQAVDRSAPLQARAFLDAVGWGVPGEPLALDVEEDAPGLVFWCENFARIILAVTGSAPVLYTNPDFLRRYDFAVLHDIGCPLWLASWGTDPADFVAPLPWGMALMHQHSDAGQVAGISAPVDLDSFAGDADDFRSLGRLV